MLYYFKCSIREFIKLDPGEIFSQIVNNSRSTVELSQQDAWTYEIMQLKNELTGVDGNIYFEFTVPRIGKRIDVVLFIRGILFVLEFKVSERNIDAIAIEQVWDYALDLHHFHESSYDRVIVPMVLKMDTEGKITYSELRQDDDKVYHPIVLAPSSIPGILKHIIANHPTEIDNCEQWEKGKYRPSPTIIEAAKSLYKNHSVDQITQREASAKNLHRTSQTVFDVIVHAKEDRRKAICFVTGVPGSGKTLVGLDIAGKMLANNNEDRSVFLSGNGPLVQVLCESLVRDKIAESKKVGIRRKKKDVQREVSKIIQNVHHYRDAYLKDTTAPYDHVAIFDEAQRAWTLPKTADFMKRRKKIVGFNHSEPEFLISCLDRHDDWAVVVCLVGGGQEINTGEAGIGEWLAAIASSFPKWDVYLAPNLEQYDDRIGGLLQDHRLSNRLNIKEELHLSVSMRSFRSEKVSYLVDRVLERDSAAAAKTLKEIDDRYPVFITRDFQKAKEWLRANARGSERFGIIVSSQAERLKPYAFDVKAPINPVIWFLNNKNDIRSSIFLEDVATEFHVQGLELDWVCVAWDADFRFGSNQWHHHSFRGNKWMNIKNEDRIRYQKNAYRVLMTRARKGMIIVVPPGDADDHTRKPMYYDPTYRYLKAIGFDEL